MRLCLISICFLLACIAALFLGATARAAEADPANMTWKVPLAGNAYVASGKAEWRRGGLRWESPEVVISIFFRVDRPADLQIAVRAQAAEGESTIQATIAGKVTKVNLAGGEAKSYPLGRVPVEQAGYVRVDLQGVTKAGPVFAEITELEIASTTPQLALAFVRDNEGNRFYWGRRGPSVHLGFSAPPERTIEWFYSELTVPEGKDPIGSYFMANGFGEGYFGIQVNSATERRVLFSVWSPFSTDNPRNIPPDQRVELLAKGEGVRSGEFGNEGSGGQSYLVYPWKPGATHRFLNRAKPDGKGGTIYTAWFQPGAVGQAFQPANTAAWRLIASFRRPKTDKHLTGLHSFLENFSPDNGWLEREGRYGNQWARDTDGRWHPLRTARFTGDDIARRGYRLDYAGGVADGTFFLKNGGFFADTVKLDSRFTRPTEEKADPPVIDFERLEGVAAGSK
jgi:hypothetical protein